MADEASTGKNCQTTSVVCEVFKHSLQLQSFSDKMEVSLKRVDSSVLACHSSKNILTKYNCTELKAIQDSKLAQAPPQCLYDPNIIRLNILKYSGKHPDGYDDECKSFREKLHNLSLSSWDPKFLELLNNYHNSLLYPEIVNNNQSRPGIV